MDGLSKRMNALEALRRDIDDIVVLLKDLEHIADMPIFSKVCTVAIRGLEDCIQGAQELDDDIAELREYMKSYRLAETNVDRMFKAMDALHSAMCQMDNGQLQLFKEMPEANIFIDAANIFARRTDISHEVK